VYKVRSHFILSTDHPHSRTTTTATRRAHTLFAVPDTVNHHGRVGVQGTLAFLPFLLYLLTPFPEQQQRQQRAGIQVRSHFPFISLYIPTTYTSQTISTGDRCRRQQECPLPDALLSQLGRSPHPSLHETQDGGVLHIISESPLFRTTKDKGDGSSLFQSPLLLRTKQNFVETWLYSNTD
jgi:hypothetical protein